jgi:hypothetical protein
MTLTGRVANGVIVLDSPISWTEGTAVRVEAITQSPAVERAARQQQLLGLLERWNAENAEEDTRLEALLQRELQEDHGIAFGDESDLERILTQP